MELIGISADERIFPIVPEAVQHVIKSYADKAGVKKIRVHDVRHSHCAYLIYRGVQPMIIKKRLGHKDIKITRKHLFLRAMSLSSKNPAECCESQVHTGIALREETGRMDV